MQLSDLVGRVRKTLGEVEPSGYGSQQPEQGTWDNTQIIGYLNEALNELAEPWRKEAYQALPTSVGQTTFNLPSDCLEDGLRKVIYDNGQTKYSCVFVDFDDYMRYSNESSGYVTNNHIYTVWDEQILLYPAIVFNTESISVYYYRLPITLVNATDIPEIPARFHPALTFYALRECQNAVEEVNLEGDAGAKWERAKQDFRQAMARRQRDNVQVRSRRR